MPQCVYCHNELAPNATRCPHCGNTDPFGAKALREVGEAMSGLFGNFFVDMTALTKRIIFTIVEIVAMVITFRMATEIDDVPAFKWITTALFLLMLVATWIIPKDWF